MAGPLSGLRVVELAGIGPAPFCARLLADLGAVVTRIDRPATAQTGLPTGLDHLQGRGKESVVVDLKRPEGVEVVLRLIERADVFIDPLRPGVVERLGLGPDDCLVRNPRLVYGRITGWGREGPLAVRAGHDINYAGLVGALHAVGRAGQRPVPPLNLIADYGGGALYLALGVLAALHERSVSGRGQVVDAAMIDGAASLMAPAFEMVNRGFWNDERGSNLLDGGAPFYDTYETSDGKYLAVGPIEARFFGELLSGLGLDADGLPDQLDRDSWAVLRARIEAAFKTGTRRYWEDVFAGKDACVTPVLSLREAPLHPHHVSRATFLETDSGPEPAPAPRFGRSEVPVPGPPPVPGRDTVDVLMAAGLAPADIEALLGAGIVAEGAAP